jgi:hypothetical protein
MWGSMSVVIAFASLGESGGGEERGGRQRGRKLPFPLPFYFFFISFIYLSII